MSASAACKICLGVGGSCLPTRATCRPTNLRGSASACFCRLNCWRPGLPARHPRRADQGARLDPFLGLVEGGTNREAGLGLPGRLLDSSKLQAQALTENSGCGSEQAPLPFLVACAFVSAALAGRAVVPGLVWQFGHMRRWIDRMGSAKQLASSILQAPSRHNQRSVAAACGLKWLAYTSFDHCMPTLELQRGLVGRQPMTNGPKPNGWPANNISGAAFCRRISGIHDAGVELTPTFAGRSRRSCRMKPSAST